MFQLGHYSNFHQNLHTLYTQTCAKFQVKSSSKMEKQNMFLNALNCASEQLENCFFNPNWDNSMNTNDPFHSALSSMVSSPSPSNAVVGDAIVARELIGRLGNSVNSPPELKLSILDRQISPATYPVNGNRFSSPPFSADLGFAERAARLSCFAGENLVESVKIGDENAEVCESMENSSVSEQIAANDANCRKRKAISKGKAKANPSTNSTNQVSPENSESSAKKSKSDDQKSAEPPKDYIHVRARRGQATDAHSLAERVRREKISERMKLLQDIVPGCNKVTGKAVMLDEIINYVQSLQKQVEFLSMKLANVNPSVDFDVEALLSKDMFQSRGAIHHNPQPSDYSFQCQQGPNLHSVVPSRIDVTFPTNPFDDASGRTQSKQHLPLENFSEMISTFWEDDLHSLVQMGIGQNQTQSFHGILPTSQMKAER